jgi:hypothetical protein
MKQKAVVLIFVFTLITATSFSQTVKEKIEKQIKDPKNAENSGKADIYIQKKIIYDPVVIQTKDQSVISKKNRGKKYCKRDLHNQ